MTGVVVVGAVEVVHHSAFHRIIPLGGLDREFSEIE